MKAAQITETLSAFWSDQDGVTAIEYALLAAFIAMAIVGAVTVLGNEVAALYAKILAAFP